VKATKAASANERIKPGATKKATAPAPTLRSGGLQVGARIKHARLLAGIRMRDLAEKVGCTESMISKLESGRVVPSLKMLQKIVEALDRDMSSFFGSDINSPALVLRSGQRPVLLIDPLRESPGVTYERLVPFAAGTLLECNVHIIEAGGSKNDPITHQGETVGYVLEGQLEVTIDTTDYILDVGDSFFFKNHLTNSYRNPGPGTTRVLWANTPQVH
jgi:transcriptional regulator with XRE-family HTH domain